MAQEYDLNNLNYIKLYSKDNQGNSITRYPLRLNFNGNIWNARVYFNQTNSNYCYFNTEYASYGDTIHFYIERPYDSISSPATNQQIEWNTFLFHLQFENEWSWADINTADNIGALSSGYLYYKNDVLYPQLFYKPSYVYNSAKIYSSYFDIKRVGSSSWKFIDETSTHDSHETNQLFLLNIDQGSAGYNVEYYDEYGNRLELDDPFIFIYDDDHGGGDHDYYARIQDKARSDTYVVFRASDLYNKHETWFYVRQYTNTIN